MKAGQGARFQGPKDSAMTIMPDSEPDHEASPTAHLLDEIALYTEPLPPAAIAAHYQAWLTTTAGAAPERGQSGRAAA